MNQSAKHTPLVLAILDGWGIAADWGGNAISLAKTPTVHEFMRTMPHTALAASGEAVGLPPGINGNSEVGHLNIGAGKIVQQYLPLINKQIEDRTFFKNTVLLSAMQKAKISGTTLHLIGILSDGSVHGHIRHLYALLEMAKLLEVPTIVIHGFTDGRDTEPTGALSYIEKLNRFIKSLHSPARIATLAGRFFGMDRDNRWERTAKAFQAIVFGQAPEFESAVDAITAAYKDGLIDEFIEPVVVQNKRNPYLGMRDGDVVIMFNFRSDRARQITQALCGVAPKMDVRDHPPKLDVVTFTEYQANLPVHVAFHPDTVEKSLSVVVADKGLYQFHVAETEKYAHITYFFNGGIEAPQTHEIRLLVPSPKVQTYDEKPEMSAGLITDAVIEKLASGTIDFYVVNYANADMVGHTGNIRATIMAVEVIDSCLKRLWEAVKKSNGTLIVTADHGNAEEMINPENGLPDTEHTKNPVPLIIVTADQELNSVKLRAGGCLGNVAPTILQIMGIEKPAGMNLESLIER